MKSRILLIQQNRGVALDNKTVFVAEHYDFRFPLKATEPCLHITSIKLPFTARIISYKMIYKYLSNSSKMVRQVRTCCSRRDCFSWCAFSCMSSRSSSAVIKPSRFCTLLLASTRSCESHYTQFTTYTVALMQTCIT